MGYFFYFVILKCFPSLVKCNNGKQEPSSLTENYPNHKPLDDQIASETNVWRPITTNSKEGKPFFFS